MEHLDHSHDGSAHTHEHTHMGEPHTHSHEHTHDGGHDHAHGGEKAVAVLRYMLEHNNHHAAELSDMARQFTGEAQHQLLHAVESFDQANGYLSAALEQIEGENAEK